MVRLRRFERPTPKLKVTCSNQLSYRRIFGTFGESRNPNPLIKSQLHYFCATKVYWYTLRESDPSVHRLKAYCHTAWLRVHVWRPQKDSDLQLTV